MGNSAAPAQIRPPPAPANDTPANTAVKTPQFKGQDESCPITDKPGEKKLKPCCACPETKKARDACIVEKGEENCKDLIEAHKECMRKMGFKI